VSDEQAFGTRLRHVLDLMEDGIAAALTDLGLDGYRPRYSPFVRALEAAGPSTIRELADAVGVTHSAASQTVNQMRRDGLIELTPGTDARQRVAHLTDTARQLLPAIHAEWDTTTAAAATLDDELPVPLGTMIAALEDALRRTPFRQRIADAADAVDTAAEHRRALAQR